MGQRRTIRSAPLPLVAVAGVLVSLWLFHARTRPDPGRPAPATVAAPSVRAASGLLVTGPAAGPAAEPARRMAAVTGAAEEPARDGDDPASPARRELHETGEGWFYAHFLEDPDLAALEAAAPSVLRGSGPDPEKVALLRVLADRGSSQAAELYLLALHELPDVSGPRGESVPSTALNLLDRRAQRDPLAREILRRAAFDPPSPPPSLRCRAAASFFLQASAAELLAARPDLARETDPRLLESALEALSRNPNTEAAGVLLAPHGRSTAAGGAERESP